MIGWLVGWLSDWSRALGMFVSVEDHNVIQKCQKMFQTNIWTKHMFYLCFSPWKNHIIFYSNNHHNNNRLLEETRNYMSLASDRHKDQTVQSQQVDMRILEVLTVRVTSQHLKYLVYHYTVHHLDMHL